MRPTDRSPNLDQRCHFLKSVPLFETLSEAQCRQVAADFRERTYRKNEIIFHQEDQSQSLYIVQSGVVRVFHPSFTGGNDTTVNLLARPGIIGEFSLVDQKPRSATVAASRQTILLEIHRSHLLHHMRQIPDLAIAMCSHVVKKARWITFYANTIVQLDVPGRLLCFLLHFVEEYGQAIEPGLCYALNLGLKQGDLASLVGANRGYVSTILKMWKNNRLIDYDKDRITILDLPRAKLELETLMAGKETACS